MSKRTESAPAPVTMPGVKLSDHRDPAPSPAEHNAAFIAKNGPTVPRGFDSAGQCGGQ